MASGARSLLLPSGAGRRLPAAATLVFASTFPAIKYPEMAPHGRRAPSGASKAGHPGSKALTMYMDELRAQGAKPARHWDKE